MAGDGAGGAAIIELATNEFVQATPLESNAGDASAVCYRALFVMCLWVLAIGRLTCVASSLHPYLHCRYTPRLTCEGCVSVILPKYSCLLHRSCSKNGLER